MKTAKVRLAALSLALESLPSAGDEDILKRAEAFAAFLVKEDEKAPPADFRERGVRLPRDRWAP